MTTLDERGEMDERFASIMGKLRKLLAKAEGTDVPAEAEAFMAKAQELMARWQIDEALLAEAEGREAAKVTSVTIPMRAPHAARRAGLAYAVAAANRCEAIQVPDAAVASGVAAVVVGDERDVEWVVTLFTSLDHQLDAALRRSRPTRPRHESPKAWATAFVAGFIGVMHRRLREAAEVAEAEAEMAEAQANAARGGEARTSVALVLAAKSDEVRSEFRKRFPHIRTVRRSAGTSASGRRAGAIAGERASLARGAAGHAAPAALPH
jgi:hypothetical protein